ncbi:MAG TPA: glycosyltransferase family 39 protein [Acidobacteriota bacterium]|nr:glycosyltransferase family 39 protein [Acidobacteriota bacterium]
MNQKSGETFLLVLLIFGATVLFIFGSARLPFLGSDEPRLAEIAKEMMQGKEYIFPQMGGMPWLEKPIGIFWLMIASYKALGISEMAARLPAALMALLSAWLIYFLVSRLTDRKRGMVCFLMVSTSAFFVFFSHAANCDMFLTCCIIAAFVCFLLYEQEPARKSFLYAMYACAGIGVLAKGFIALIITGISILAYLVTARRVKDVLKMNALAGVLIVLCVCSIWFVPITLVGGREFWNVYFFQQQIQRYTAGLRHHHSEGILFYLPITLLGAFPWTVTPFFARKTDRPQPARNLIRLCLCWLLTTVLFFSLSKSQTSSYILPAIPPFCVLGGLFLVEYFERTEKLPLAMILLIGMTNALAILVAFWFSQKLNIYCNGLLAFLITIGVITVVSLILIANRKFVWALGLYALISFAGFYTFVNAIFPELNRIESKPLSLAIKPSLTGTTKLLIYDFPDYVPLFYTDGRIELTPEGYIYEVNNPEQLYRYLFQKETAYVLIDNLDLEWMSKDDEWKAESVVRGRDLSILKLTLPQGKHHHHRRLTG